jgi:hypothetical protein
MTSFKAGLALALVSLVGTTARAENAMTYTVETFTCDTHHAETDATILFSAWDSGPQRFATIFSREDLDNDDDNFQRNRTDSFHLRTVWSGDLTNVAFDHASSKDWWCLERARILRSDGAIWNVVIPERRTMAPWDRAEFRLERVK